MLYIKLFLGITILGLGLLAYVTIFRVYTELHSWEVKQRNICLLTMVILASAELTWLIFMIKSV